MEWLGEKMRMATTFFRVAIPTIVRVFGFWTYKKVGRERPRSAAECSGNTRHSEDAVALPIVVAVDDPQIIFSSMEGSGNIRTFNYTPFKHTKQTALASFCFVVCLQNLSVAQDPSRTTDLESRPNVLFISIDDLNDWTGFLGGHPQALTPNMDRLAKNSVVFNRSYSPAQSCNPSRTALLSGIRPSSSGVYHNGQNMRASPALENCVTLPGYFKQEGYQVLGSGKIFHGADAVSWHEYWPSLTNTIPPSQWPTDAPKPLEGTRSMTWGPVDMDKEETSDWKVADWVVKQLKRDFKKPFFLGCGFLRPHLPWYAPRSYFEKFPLDKIVLPEVNNSDWDDIPRLGKWMAQYPVHNESGQTDHTLVVKHNQWKHAVQAYLATIHFVDECLGRVMEALENSPYSDNTIIVLWSDHGWHLGEKLHWRKFSLWEEGTRTVMLFSGNNIEATGICERPVNLLDIYPTLLDLCELPENPNLEGRSITALLNDPQKAWPYPSLTTFGQNNHALRSERWRYIRYSDGSEELYDHRQDPLEWNNLIDKPSSLKIQRKFQPWLPETNVPNIPFVEGYAKEVYDLWVDALKDIP